LQEAKNYLIWLGLAKSFSRFIWQLCGWRLYLCDRSTERRLWLYTYVSK